MANNIPSVGIVGGGISGLCTAYALQKHGVEPTVYEKASSPGGVIKSVRQDPWLVELGPNTLMLRSKKIEELLDDLNIKSEIMPANRHSRKRYIVKNGSLHPLPLSVSDFITTDLFSSKAKLNLFREPFVSRAGNKDETVAEFITRRLGKEVLDYAVNPFIAGIYAGDPKALSIKHTFSRLHELEQQSGSLLLGGLKSLLSNRSSADKPKQKGLLSFRNGLQTLPLALDRELSGSVKTDCEITGIERTETGWRIVEGSNRQVFDHDIVVYTAPLHKIPSIQLKINSDSELKNLSELRYAPIATVALGYRKEHIGHPLDGFGMLVPEAEPFHLLGCLFSSSLFPGRAPEGHHLLTCFLGGDRNPELVDWQDEEIKQMVLKDLSTLLGISGSPVFEVTSRWEQAIPQYGLDYDRYLDTMDLVEKKHPGFFLTGSFRNGVSVPDCILNAFETADSITSFLES